jgi:hypothetical protein
VRNGLPQWEIDRRGEIGEIDRNVMKASLEEQFRAGMVSSQHYWQCRTEIRDARRRADLVGIGRSLPYEAQMARSAQLVKLAAFVAVWFLISTRQFWWQTFRSLAGWRVFVLTFGGVAGRVQVLRAG